MLMEPGSLFRAPTESLTARKAAFFLTGGAPLAGVTYALPVFTAFPIASTFTCDRAMPVGKSASVVSYTCFPLNGKFVPFVCFENTMQLGGHQGFWPQLQGSKVAEC